MRDLPKRLAYLVWTGVVVALGLGSRRYAATLPAAIAEYAGDTLWAMMVYAGLGIIFPVMVVRRRALLALIFSYTIEISQFYHATWIDSVRQTTVGGLVLGFGFLWSDMLATRWGATVGAALDFALFRCRRR